MKVVRRALVLALAAITVGVAPIGAGGAGGASAAGEVTAVIRLPRRTLAAGSTVEAEIVVHNRTGAPIEFVACGSPFAVALHNRSVPALVAWPACGGPGIIPTGTTTYRMPLIARYSSCSPDGPIICDGGDPPPLPPGRYLATLYQSPKVLTAHARSLRVRVVR